MQIYALRKQIYRNKGKKMTTKLIKKNSRLRLSAIWQMTHPSFPLNKKQE